MDDSAVHPVVQLTNISRSNRLVPRMQTEASDQRIPDEVADNEPLVRSLHHPYYRTSKGYLKENCIPAKNGEVSVTRLQYSSWDFCRKLAWLMDASEKLRERKKNYHGMLLLYAGPLRNIKDEGKNMCVKVQARAEGLNDAHAHIDFRDFTNGSDELSTQKVREQLNLLLAQVPQHPNTSPAGFFYIDSEPESPPWPGPSEAETCKTCL